METVPRALPCKALSLRFNSKEMEASFVQSKRPLLLRRLKRFLLLFLLGQLVSTTAATINMAARTNLTEVGRHSMMARLSAGYVLVILDGLFLIAICIRQGELVFQSHIMLEAVPVAYMILAMILGLTCKAERFVKLQGADLQDVLGSAYDSDSSLLLLLDGFVTVSHLGLPIRWYVLAPMLAATMLIYLVNVALITSEPFNNVVQNVLGLLLLVSCSSIAKRSTELDERRLLLQVISEKAMRCNAEFQLSEISGISAAVHRASDKRSEPDSDRSGGIFDTFFDARGKELEGLETVAAKGESEHWRIEASEVRLLQEEAIGSGSFGSVQRAVFSGMLVAVKCPHVENSKLPELCNELRVLRHLRHPHIVTTYGAVVLPEQQSLYLVLELMVGVRLTAFLLLPKGCCDRQPPTVLARYQVMMGVCRALLYMHTRAPSIVHGDLKGSNIMVDHQSSVVACAKVLDFGLSRVLSRRARPLGGTRAWMAPEVVERAPVLCSADVYSLGHVLSFTATGVPPVRRNFLCIQPSRPNGPYGSTFACCRPLVQSCLRRQQERRPGIREVHESLLGIAGDLDLHGQNLGLLEQVRVLKESLDRSRDSYLEELKVVAESAEANCTLEHVSGLRSSKLGSLPEEEGEPIITTSSTAEVGLSCDVAIHTQSL